MDFFKCYCAVYCRCKKNYGYAAQWRYAKCLGCGVGIINITQTKLAEPISVAIIKKHEERVTFGIKDCEHRIGVLFEDSNYAICSECGHTAEITTKIDKEIGEFILNVL